MSVRANFKDKLIDRYIGIPLIYLLSFLKIKNTFDQYSQVKSIAILKENALGDTSLLTGILKDLRIRYPSAHLTLFTGSTNFILKPNIPAVDKVIELPLKSPLKVLSILRKQRFDIFIDSGAWPRINAIYSFFAKAKITIGFQSYKQYRHYAYDYPVLHRKNVHELENYRALLSPLKITQFESPQLIKIKEDPKLQSQKYLVFHLSAGGENAHLRQWPIENWKVVNQWASKNGFKVYLTGSKNDKELNEELIRDSNTINLAAHLSFQEQLSYIKQSTAVVSINTGLMHIASILNVLTIGLSGPTNPKRWGPLGNRVISIDPGHPQCGFLHLGFEYKNQKLDCMHEIKPEVVIEVLENQLRL